MEINKRNRTDLKSYFVKNNIPTESNFADLIDSMLNQKDDGIVKLPDNPLSIQASGDNASLQKVINFYQNFADADAKPAWMLNLNPRSDPNKPETARLSFSISDGQGNSRLYIDPNSGNVSIGTTAPTAKLDVCGDVFIGTGKDSENHKLVIRGPNQPLGNGSHQALSYEFKDAGSARVRAYRGVEWDTYLQFLTNALGTLKDDPQVRLHIDGLGNVGIGTTTPTAKLDVNGNANVSGNITSPKWCATQLFSSERGPLPISKDFTTGGGKLVIFASGSVFAEGVGEIGMDISLNEKVVGAAKIYNNDIEKGNHKTITVNAIVQSGIPAGNCKITLGINPTMATTKTNIDDSYSVTVLELPF